VIEERIDVMAPHPLATLRFERVQVHETARIGAAGAGFKVAMATLDVFRTSVAAAALGFARRALDESLAWAKQRKMFGQSLADFQITQSKCFSLCALVYKQPGLSNRVAKSYLLELLDEGLHPLLLANAYHANEW
jgi:acyl-CoA dehydrogenase